ncbi:MAG: pitrilysin family protein, partial [Phycisphaerae bacterium]
MGQAASAPSVTAPAPIGSTVQHTATLANGLQLVAEQMPHVRSVAMSLLIPAGAATDPDNAGGAANVLSDWMLRGAGKRDSRELTSYLDDLGVQRGSTAETIFLRFSAAMLSSKLLQVLPVYGEIVQQPMLPDDGFAPSVDLAIQQIKSIEDEPAQKLYLLLRGQHYDYPLGRCGAGIQSELEALTAAALRADFQRRVGPENAILALAGNFDWPTVKDCVEKVFGGWARRPAPAIIPRPAPRGCKQVIQKTNQTQIGLAFDTIPERETDSILMQAAVSVLSGGMGARLFTEIREKQGLCYSVQAGYQSFREEAAVIGYSGTAPERAQRTLDAFLVELRRLRQGVTAEELSRAIVGMKSRLLM